MTRTGLSRAVIFLCILPLLWTPAFGESGVCSVAAGTVGAKKFVTLKCYLSSEPGEYKIRSTVWERDDAAEYRKLARLSGRRFTCNLAKSGSSTTGGVEGRRISTSYKISGCR